MIEHLHQTEKHLKARVKQNLQKVEANNQAIRKLLAEPVSRERSMKISKMREQNKKYLEENEEAIRIQHDINRFILHYRKNMREDSEHIGVSSGGNHLNKQTLSKEESFKKTINGELPYNPAHPYYGDQAFKEKLLHHYQALEDYETCAWLVKINEAKSNS